MARGKTLGRRVERVMSETAVHRPAPVVSLLLIALLLVPVGGLAAGVWAAQDRVVEPLVVRFQVTGQPIPPPAQSVPTQQPAVSRQNVTPAAVEARAQVGETANFLAQWSGREVPYIISPAEHAAFATLKSDEEREVFIETFWRLRDPTPGTVDNEFRNEYYRRIVLANEQFTTRTGVPGWQTDRGRILVLHGQPDEIERHAIGGTYMRDIEKGGARTNTFPFERWRYRHIDNIGNNVILEFVDSSMNGEYHLEFDPAAKDGLIQVPAPPR